MIEYGFATQKFAIVAKAIKFAGSQPKHEFFPKPELHDNGFQFTPSTCESSPLRQEYCLRKKRLKLLMYQGRIGRMHGKLGTDR